MATGFLCHLVDQDAWRDHSAERFYAPSSLAREGFIHLSTLAQVSATASRYYVGRQDLLLLVIAEERLTSPVRWEDLYGHGEYPHLYEPLNKDAITCVVPFPCHDNGTFTLPDTVKVAYASSR